MKKTWRQIPPMSEINALKKKHTAISFFSGCGGSSTGYKLARYNVLYANEFIPEAANTYIANHIGTKVDTRDIRKINPKTLLKSLDLKVGELDLLDGSPPCHPEGTLVFTKRGYVEIQNIVEGDYVLTHQNRWRKVTGTTKRMYKGQMLKLTTVNGESVHCTPNHLFYVRNNEISWKEANCLTTESCLKVLNRNTTESISVQCKDEVWIRLGKTEYYDFEGYVYNMHVEEDESFTANNIASHNCSGFSAAGTREKGWGIEKKYSDSKQRVDDLFNEYIRMVDHICPKVFVAENVPGLAAGNAKGYLQEVIQQLQQCGSKNKFGHWKTVGANSMYVGYKVKVVVLDAAFFDVPQSRNRLIIVGVRQDLVDLGFEPVTPKSNPYKINICDVFPYMTGIREARSMSYIHTKRPFFTITASDSTTTETAQFSSGGFIETAKGEQRKLTLKELRAASSFPSDFKLTGTFEQRWERIGRAVPPMLMYHIARAISKEILIPYYKIKSLT